MKCVIVFWRAIGEDYDLVEAECAWRYSCSGDRRMQG